MNTFIKYLLLPCAVCAIGIVCGEANAIVVQGQSSPGVYQNVQTDTNGVVAVSGTLTDVPPTGALTDRSGTISVGGTSQQLAPANTSRKYLFIQNVSDTNMWINFTVDAVTTQPSILLLPNASFTMQSGFVSTEKVTINCASGGKAFTAKEF